MLCGEFYFGPHVSWLFAEPADLIHLHTDERAECPELELLLNVLVRESLMARPGGGAIVRSLGDTLLVLLLRTLLGSEAPPAGLLRLMSDERLMPAVFAVLETPEQPRRWRVWPPALFVARHLRPAFCPRVSPYAAGWLSTAADGNGCASAARGAADQP